MKRRKLPLSVKFGVVCLLGTLSFGGGFFLSHQSARYLKSGLKSGSFFKLAGIDLEVSPEIKLAGYPSQAYFLAAAAIAPGTSLWKVDLKQLQHRLEGLPWVKQAQVSRRFPDRLSLKITLHEPVAILSLQKLYYVDADGTIFKELQGLDHKDFPLITGLAEQDLEQRPEIFRAGIKQTIGLLDTLQNSGFSALVSSRVSEVHLQPDIDENWEFSVFLSGSGTEIRLGSAPFDERLRRLALLQKHTRGQIFQAAVVDLRFKDRAVAVPKRNTGENGRGPDLL